MKIKIIIFILMAVLVYANSAESGAAVAKRGAAAHKKSMPPQLPPGYVLGPNGIQKVSETSENDAQQAAEEENVEVKDEVGLDQIMEALQSSGKSWGLIISRKDKEIVVQEFIKQYAKEGIVIRKPAVYYANFIDEMVKGSPEMLELPFERVLQVVAVMEYDFENGQNKDLLAQKILGPQVYEKNKKRLLAAAPGQ